MANFQEHVRLITDAQETLAAIAKVNEAISLLRKNASEPITMKIKDELVKTGQEHQKLKEAKDKSLEAEKKAHEIRMANAKAIKAMNAEQGNPAHEIRYGSPASINNAQKFNAQLEESTIRINRLADAYKHIKQTAKDAGIELPAGLQERLAGQTVNKVETAEVRGERERISAINLRRQQEEYGAQYNIALEKEALKLKQQEEALDLKRIAFSMKLKENNEAIEASAGAKAQIEMEREIVAMEKERVRLVRERQAQEEEGAKRVIAMEKAEQKEKEQIRRAQERQLASSREGGIRGLASEAYRDTRRNLIYGGIARAEEFGREAFHADVDRSDTLEFLRQAGRTAAQIDQMQAKAQQISTMFPTLTVSELMKLQQHNIGAVGNFDEGERSTALSAAFIAMRKQKVGEDQALSENIALQKVGEEKGKINDPEFMKRLYDQSIRISQVEGTQFDPAQMLTMTRMLKSSKFGLSDDQFFNVMPYLGIAEGMGRAGNEVAMLMKSLTYSGASLSKQTKAEIAGTVMSDGKAGYNPKLAEMVAAGNLPGIIDMTHQYLMQKHLDPSDTSSANINKEIQALAPVIANSSAREALITFVENRKQFEKQQAQSAGAQGINASVNLPERSLTSAIDAVKAQADNMNANLLKPFNGVITRFLNGTAYLERVASDNPGTASSVIIGTAATALTGLAAALKENPKGVMDSANLQAIAVSTGITARNTGAMALEGGAGGLGGKGRGALSIGAVGGAAIASDAILLASQYAAEKMSESAVRADVDNWKKNIDFAKTSQRKLMDMYNAGNFKNEADPNDKRLTKDTIIRQIAIIQRAINEGAAEAIKQNQNGVPLSAGILEQMRVMTQENLNKSQVGHGRGLPSTGKPTWHFDNGIYVPPEEVHEQYGTSNNVFPSLPIKTNPTIVNPGWNSNGPAPFPDAMHNHEVQGIDHGASLNNIWSKIEDAGSAAGAALGSAGSAIKGGIEGAASEISGAGGAVVSALHQIAGEIASVRVASPTATVVPNTGRQERGPQ